MRVLVVTIVCLLSLLGPAAAEDDPKKASPKSLTAEQVADAVLKAVKAKDAKALKALAKKDEPDPWLVADELCYRGEHDAARAFAKAAPRVDVEGLPAYVKAWRKRKPDTVERKLLAKMNAALQAGKPLKVVRGTASLTEDVGSVVRIRLAHSRGMALGMVRRLDESVAVLRAGADAARALGWLARAAALYYAAGSSASRRSDWASTLELWQAHLAVEERRAHKAGAAKALGSIGTVYWSLGDYEKALATYERALRQKEALGDKAGAAATLFNIGLVYNSLGNYAKALSTWERALRKMEALGNKAGAATVLGYIGQIHLSLGETAKALSTYERALSAMEALGDKARAAETLGNIGVSHSRLGNDAKAISTWERALSAMEALGDKARAAETLGNIGVSHSRLGDDAKAISTWERALRQMEALGDKVGAARMLGYIGDVHLRLEETTKALSIYEKALAAQEALGDKAGAARTLTNIGLLHYRLGNYAKALSTWERALRQKEALGDKAGAATVLGNIGNVHERLGDYAKALSTCERALSAMEALGDKAGAARTLGSIAVVHEHLGDYAKALSIQERALAAQEALGAKTGAARTLANIGAVHLSLGDYAKALSTYERALAAQEALGDKRGAAITLNSIGVVHLVLGNYAKALSIGERALAAHEALGDKAGAAGSLGNIGNVHMRLGDYAKALSILERVLSAMEALGHKNGAAQVLDNIGEVYLCLGETAKALSIHERALAAQEALGNKAGAATTLGIIGNGHFQLGDYAKALSTYERVLPAMEALGDKAGAARMLASIGYAYVMLGDFAKAQASYERALGLRGDVVNPNSQTDILRGLAKLHLHRGRSAQAADWALKGIAYLGALSTGLAEGEGAGARDQFTALFDVAYLATLRSDDSARLALVMEQGRAGSLRENLGSRSAMEAAVIPVKLRNSLALARHSERRALDSYKRASRRRVKAKIRAAKTAWQAAQAEVARVSRRVQREAKQAAAITLSDPDDLKTIQSYLDPTDALIYYALTSEEAVALVVRRGGARVVKLPASKDVEEAAEELDASDLGVESASTIALLRRLIIEPLTLSKDVKRVLVSPMGRLGYVPFSLLFPDHEVTNVPSGTTYGLLLDEHGKHGKKILGFGDPDYLTMVDASALKLRAGGVTKLSRLPATKKEVEAIADVSLLDKRATETGLQDAVKAQERWRAVHFACHGLVDPERPMLSALALTADQENDGFLTALEIFLMKIPADLVVMSACETGKGKIYKTEGIVGLTRAFMFAGAPRVICSLWKVDDEATQALMVEFYRLWNPKDGYKGIGTAAALKKAQAFVRDHPKHPEWKHPYYWAAWVLWGLPN